MRWHAQLQGCDAASEDSILKAIRLTHRNTVGILVSAVGSQRLVAGSRRRGLRVPAVLPGTPRFAQICGYASPLTHVLEHRHDLLNVGRVARHALPRAAAGSHHMVTEDEQRS